jgi:rhodanese-related sulfurtransferase
MLRFFNFVVAISFLITIIGCSSIPDKDKSTPEPVPVKKTEPLLVQAIKAIKAYDMLEKDAENILFVDVRTVGEVERGVAKYLDANVPYLLLKRMENGEGFESVINSDFVYKIEERLEDKDLNKRSVIILICQIDIRSGMAAKALAKLGYKNVFSVSGGFSVWKQSNLPWTADMPIGPIGCDFDGL